MSAVQGQRSEVARLLKQIRDEYESAQQGLSGLASGTSQHVFITCKMEHMGKLQEELQDLIGDEATALIVQQLEALPDMPRLTISL